MSEEEVQTRLILSILHEMIPIGGTYQADRRPRVAA